MLLLMGSAKHRYSRHQLRISQMDIERVRVGQTADTNLQECGMSLLDVITLVPRRSSKLPAQEGG